MVAVRDASVVMDEFEIKIPTASWRRACFEPVHSSERNIGDKPGGQLRPFCVQL
jgi:hypothetical protein